MTGGHNLVFKEPGLRKWADNFAFGVMIGRCVVQLHFVCLTLKISGGKKPGAFISHRWPRPLNLDVGQPLRAS